MSARDRALPKHAFDAVNALVNDAQTSKTMRDKYATQARRLPSLLQSAGLGQSVAFLISRTGAEKLAADRLLEDLGRWLIRDQMKDKNQIDGRRLMDAILSAEPAAYRRMTREAATLADWLKRFATGLIGKGEA